MASLTMRELLCRRGFFPRELPPCFSSESYDEAAVSTFLSSWGSKPVKWCKADRFSSARKSHGRRILHIVNPLPFAHLANQIQVDWTDISNHLSSNPTNAGTISFSDTSLRSISVNTGTRKSEAEGVADSLYFPVSLESDVSKCYASIYTHVLTWALSGKMVAKAATRGTTLLGTKLDKLVAALNEGQTKGITIGQYSSRILAEIVLSSVDKDLADRLASKVDYKSRRFIDDYKIYTNNTVDAQHALSALSQAALSFELEVNADKTKISDPAINVELAWVTPTRRAIDMATSKSVNRMVGGFAEVFALYQVYQDENLMRFFTEALYTVDFQEVDMEVFCSLLIKVAEMSPNTLDSIVVILLLCNEYSTKFPAKAITKSFNRMLSMAASLGRDFECCWILWASKSLKLTLENSTIINCLSSASSATRIISRYIAFEQGLEKHFTNDQITTDAVNEDFSSSSDWLCAYESVRLSLFGKKVDESTFKAAFMHTDFSILFNQKVKFFDENLFGSNANTYLEKAYPRFGYASSKMTHKTDGIDVLDLILPGITGSYE